MATSKIKSSGITRTDLCTFGAYWSEGTEITLNQAANNFDLILVLIGLNSVDVAGGGQSYYIIRPTDIQLRFENSNRGNTSRYYWICSFNNDFTKFIINKTNMTSGSNNEQYQGIRSIVGLRFA